MEKNQSMEKIQKIQSVKVNMQKDNKEKSKKRKDNKIDKTKLWNDFDKEVNVGDAHISCIWR